MWEWCKLQAEHTVTRSIQRLQGTGEHWGTQPHKGCELNMDPILKQPLLFMGLFSICPIIISRL